MSRFAPRTAAPTTSPGASAITPRPAARRALASQAAPGTYVPMHFAAPPRGARATDDASVQVRATPGAAQAKLAVGAADCPAEREADLVADAIVGHGQAPRGGALPSAATMQRKCAACDEKDKDKTLRRDATPGGAVSEGAPPIVHDVLRSTGRPLDAGLRAEMERGFGQDFGAVRIHTGPQADASARAVGALAYTVGPDVVFRGDAYAPHNRAGRWLLAHELTHVVQQGAASSSGSVPVPGGLRPGSVGPSVQAFPPARPPVRFVPVRPPPARAGTPGVGTPGSLPSGPGVRQPPELVTRESAWDFLADRARGQQALLNQVVEAERPVATLQRGGRAEEGFVEATNGTTVEVLNTPRRAAVTTRVFHVLDALEHDLAAARTADEVWAVLRAYIPEQHLPQRPGAGLTPPTAHISIPWDVVLPVNLDSGGAQRIATSRAAIEQWIRAHQPEPAPPSASPQTATTGQPGQAPRTQVASPVPGAGLPTPVRERCPVPANEISDFGNWGTEREGMRTVGGWMQTLIPQDRMTDYTGCVVYETGPVDDRCWVPNSRCRRNTRVDGSRWTCTGNEWGPDWVGLGEVCVNDYQQNPNVRLPCTITAHQTMFIETSRGAHPYKTNELVVEVHHDKVVSTRDDETAERPWPPPARGPRTRRP